MHVFHVSHRSGAEFPPGRIATLILWLLVVFLALMCLSARRAAATAADARLSGPGGSSTGVSAPA